MRPTESRLSVQPTVIGLDLSLTCTGLAIIRPTWDCGVANVEVRSFPTERDEDETEAMRLTRILNIASWVQWIVSDLVAEASSVEGPTPHVFVEHYAFSRFRDSSASSLCELGGVVKIRILEGAGIIAQPVSSSSCRSLFLGKGRVKKGAKLLVQQALKQIGFSGNGDEGDALVVANYGVSELGFPAIADVVGAHERLATLAIPDVVGAHERLATLPKKRVKR